MRLKIPASNFNFACTDRIVSTRIYPTLISTLLSCKHLRAHRSLFILPFLILVCALYRGLSTETRISLSFSNALKRCSASIQRASNPSNSSHPPRLTARSYLRLHSNPFNISISLAPLFMRVVQVPIISCFLDGIDIDIGFAQTNLNTLDSGDA